MSKTVHEKVRTPITKLEVGDFVEEVTKQLGTIQVTQTGLVKNYFALQDLKKKGVIEVLVDPNRSKKKVEPSPTSTHKKTKIENLLSDALAWQEQAHSLIDDTLARAESHIPIDISGLQHLATRALELTRQHKEAIALAVRCKMPNAQLNSHLIRVAVSLAQFCVHQNYQPVASQHMVLAGLLSRVGYQMLPQNLRLPDNKLPSLLKIKKQSHITQLQKLLHVSGQPDEHVSRLIAEQNELLDGSGYPNQLDIDRLNSAQRIMSIALMYDSLVYGFDQNKALGSAVAYRELMDRSPSHYDPDLLQMFIQAIGVYPAGTLVKLASGRIALVIENQRQLTAPRVKVFYNAEFNHHLAMRIIDLTDSDDSIEGTASAHRYGVDISNLISENGI